MVGTNLLFDGRLSYIGGRKWVGFYLGSVTGFHVTGCHSISNASAVYLTDALDGNAVYSEKRNNAHTQMQ